jgi:hypothetical protein
MQKQNLNGRDAARLMRGATAGDPRAWGRQVDQYSRLVGGTAECKRGAQLLGAPASAGSRRAPRRSISCLAKGVLREAGS